MFSCPVVSNFLHLTDCGMPGLPVPHHLRVPTFMSVALVMPSNHLIICHPLLLVPSMFSSIRAFSNESAVQSGDQNAGASASASVLSMSIQDCFPLRGTGLLSLLSKGTLKSLLQHHSSKAKILQRLAFFMVKLSHTWASLVAQLVKNLPAMQETPVQFLGQEDPLEKR